jgi:hypothetical protein
MPIRPTGPQDHGSRSEPDVTLRDISQLNTTFLVPRTSVEAASVTLIAEHKAAAEYLRDLQDAVVREVADAQSRERRAASEELRAILKGHIQELWSYLRKLDRQAVDHEQALERLLKQD